MQTRSTERRTKAKATGNEREGKVEGWKAKDAAEQSPETPRMHAKKEGRERKDKQKKGL